MEKFKSTLKHLFVLFCERKTIIKLLIIAMVIGIVYVLSNLTFWVQSSKYKSVNAQSYINERKELEEGTEIPVSSTDLLVSENDKYTLSINTKTTNVIVESKATGNKWMTLPKTTGLTLYGTEKSYSQANVILEYEVVANKKQFFTLNSYDDCVSTYIQSMPTYKLYQIDGGLRIDYQIEKSDITMNYFPVKLTYERMNELLLEREDDLIEDKYKKLITKQIYEEDKANECWIRRDSAPVSSRKTFYEILYDLIGYTFDDLANDNMVFGVETSVPSLPSFNISMEFRLNDDFLEVNVPTYGFTENETYRIKNVTLLPYFGAADLNKEGYIFVPDGSGALIDFNSYTPSSLYYVKQIYDNDALYTSGYANAAFKTSSISMPVTGIINETESTGLMMVVDNGAEMSKIIASSSGYMSNAFNLCYTNISYIVQDSVGLYDAYDTNKVILEAEDVIFYDYTLDYFMLENDDANYYSMAKKYSNYLKNKYEIERSYSNEPTLVLETIGGVTVVTKLFGISYNKEIPLTTARDVLTINDELRDSGIDDIRFIYQGWCNTGINQQSMVKIKPLRKIFKETSIKDLEVKLSETNTPISFATNLINIYGNKKNGFNRNSYASRTMDNTPLTLHRYRISGSTFDDSSASYYYLSPKYLNDYYKRLTTNIKKVGIDSVIFNDFGREFMADYNRNNIISGIQARLMIDEALANNSMDNQLFRDPFDYYLGYASYIADVEYESSNLYCFTATIPFKELVYNGLISYSSSDINNNTIDFSNIGLLKALETGSDLKFLITYRNTTELKTTDYHYIYSSDYSNWKEDIISLYQKQKEFYESVASRIITNHERLSQNVYEVTYEGGTSVIFNYSNEEYTYGSVVVEAESYRIL